MALKKRYVMTKQERKEIYWAAMFESIAFSADTWSSLDASLGYFARASIFPEIFIGESSVETLERLSKAIDLCEQ